MAETSDYTYQNNAYFGIFYKADDINTVLELVKLNPTFAELADEDAELKIGKIILFASTNNDEEGAATTGFIAADDMTFEGPDMKNPEESMLRLEPTEMEKREAKYKVAVTALTDLYDHLVREFKLRKISVDKLYLGWNVLTCTWDLDDSIESSTTTEELPVTKNNFTKKAAREVNSKPNIVVQKPLVVDTPVNRKKNGKK